jgi:hypothetical protein
MTRRPRFYIHLGCLGCSLPLLAVLGCATGLRIVTKLASHHDNGGKPARVESLRNADTLTPTGYPNYN